MLSMFARWSAAVAVLAAVPAVAQTAKPGIRAVGTVLTYAATIRSGVPGKPSHEAEFRMLRRVVEAGDGWFKIAYDVPTNDKTLHLVEKHSADPFAPALSTESVLLTSQGDPAVAGASLKLGERSDGEVTGGLFPLEIGKTAHYRFISVGSAGEAPGVSDCKVESLDSVTVPMGTYDAFAVRCRAMASPSPDTRIDTETVYRYAGDLGAVVSGDSHIMTTKVSEMKLQFEIRTTTKLVQIDTPPPHR